MKYKCVVLEGSRKSIVYEDLIVILKNRKMIIAICETVMDSFFWLICVMWQKHFLEENK